MAVLYFFSLFLGSIRRVLLLLFITWVLLVVRTFDLLRTTEITISAAWLMWESTSPTSWRTIVLIIVDPLSPAPLRWEGSLTISSTPHTTRAHSTSAPSVSLHPATTELLVIFATIFIAIFKRLFLFEVFEGIRATPTLASPIRLKPSVAVLPELSLLIWVPVPPSHGGTASGPVIEHQSLAASIRRRLLIVSIFFIIRVKVIFLRLTIESLRSLNDHEFILIINNRLSIWLLVSMLIDWVIMASFGHVQDRLLMAIRNK
jgi:hypothetical protein